jgi:adenosylmethionine-8-amino-7-oxononanoate aminotransferase
MQSMLAEHARRVYNPCVSTPQPSRSALFPRSFTKVYPQAVRGEGVWLFDAAGKKYLDLCGSAVVNFIGHGVKEVGDAMAAQAAQLEFVHGSQFVTDVAEQFAREVLDFAGENFRGGAVFFTSGGSEAVETALKMARQYQVEIGQPKRHRIISRRQSYHGATMGAMAVSGNLLRREIYLPMLRDSTKINSPYPYRCPYHCTDQCDKCGHKLAQELDEALSSCYGEAAAFIFEPVSGATLGAITPPNGYLRDIAGIARRHGILLISDEVMTGMGRTGRNFCYEHWSKGDWAPDIICAAKGIASGYAPLGAVIVTAKVVDAIANGSGSLVHGFTYSAHPTALAAGRAVLGLIKKKDLVHAATSERRGYSDERLKDPSETAGHKMRTALRTLSDLPHVGDVRGIGLLWAVELVADKHARTPFTPGKKFSAAVGNACMKRGVMVYPMQGSVDGSSGDHILVSPPAVITSAEIDWGIAQLRDAIEEVSRL